MNSVAMSAGVSAPEPASTPAGGDLVRPAASRAWKIDWMVALILPVLLGIAWELAVRFGYASGRLMPPPSRLAVTALALIRSGELQTHIAATMTRVALGFLFGSIAGTAIGTLAGASAPMRRLLDPSIQALRAIPSIAWVPLFILWLGIFETSKLALVSLGVFFPVYLGVFSAIQDVDRKLLEVGRVFGLSPLAQVRRITCRRSCRPGSRRCVPASASASCSCSPPNCSARPRGWAICCSTASRWAGRTPSWSP